MSDHGLYAGASKVDITPPLGTVINGDFVVHTAEVIHDPLYAKALVMQNGAHVIAIVVVDICAMRQEFISMVKSAVYKSTSIKPQDVLISSTHTHASGSVEELLLVDADPRYRERLPGLVVEAVIRARQNLRPATVAFGAVDVPEHVVCRRFYMKPGYVAANPVTGGIDAVKTNPFGDEDHIDRRASQVDPSVGFMAVRGRDGRWISVVANYSMHYVGDWPNGTITADYFGTFSRHIAETLGAAQDFVAMMSNGTSGEANIWDFIHPGRDPKTPFAKSDKIGGDIANRVALALNDATWQSGPFIKTAYREIDVGTRKPSQEEVTAAARLAGSTDFSSIRTVDYDALRKIYAREQVLLHGFPEAVRFPVQAIRIGEAVIGGLGGEFFSETGLWLKANCPFKHYFTVCLANDYVGYVPPAHEIDAGGYETWRCRTSHLHKEAENVIRGELLRLINELR